MPKERISVMRGDTNTVVTAERDGNKFSFPTSSLAYKPDRNMGIRVNGEPVVDGSIWWDGKVEMVSMWVGAGPPAAN
jgi:hypothetical protein